MATEKTSTISASQKPANQSNGNIQVSGHSGAAPTHSHLAKAQPGCYSPYGFRNTKTHPVGTLGFTGEYLSAELECYALGNGHRIYSPRLMRFISPDSWSPFSKGGLNTYAYCLNDPVNAKDSSGRWPTRAVVQRTTRLLSRAVAQSPLKMFSRAVTQNPMNMFSRPFSQKVSEAAQTRSGFLKMFGIKASAESNSTAAVGRGSIVDTRYIPIKTALELQSAINWKRPRNFTFDNTDVLPLSVQRDGHHPPPAGLENGRAINEGVISLKNGAYRILSFTGPDETRSALHMHLATIIGVRVDPIT